MIARYSQLLGMARRTAREQQEFDGLKEALTRMLSDSVTPMQRRVEVAVKHVLAAMRPGAVEEDSLALDAEVRRRVLEILGGGCHDPDSIPGAGQPGMEGLAQGGGGTARNVLVAIAGRIGSRRSRPRPTPPRCSPWLRVQSGPQYLYEEKGRLDRGYLGKCVYCEGKFGLVTYGDLDHYRPKQQIKQGSGKVVQIKIRGHEIPHPGYFWLAYDYRNLLPTCDRCNRTSKGSRFPDERGLCHHTGARG